jgi:hypothetical protein
MQFESLEFRHSSQVRVQSGSRDHGGRGVLMLVNPIIGCAMENGRLLRKPKSVEKVNTYFSKNAK